MKTILKIAIFLALISFTNMKSQEKFAFPENVKRDKIKFQLINNLILIPVKINNVELTFLLDTGSNSTVIFSFEEKDSILLNNSSLVSLRGMGKGDAVQAIKSENNKMQIGKATKQDQTIFVVFDGTLNFSSRLGVAVHGIIGNDFFRDFVVGVNNVSQRMRFYKPDAYRKRICRRCVEKKLFFISEKPHLTAKVIDGENEVELNLLIDSGSGDALWLFEDEQNKIKAPLNTFVDYLGLGINGNIYGKRTKVDAFVLDEFYFEDVNTAFPDIEFLRGSTLLDNRQGSLGGSILKRFNWIIDYQNQNIILKKNKFFNDPFHYNMSGLTLEQGGYTLVREITGNTHFYEQDKESLGSSVFNMDLSKRATISLKQVFIIVEVRDGSPASQAGIKPGDEIIEINNKPAYRYKLQEINEMFHAKEGKTINMKIHRRGFEQEVKFDLKDI